MNKMKQQAGAIFSGLVFLALFLVILPRAHGLREKVNLSIQGESRQSTDQPVEFAVIGDYGSGQDPAEQVAGMINGLAVDFVITVGDNYYSGAGGKGGNGLDQLDNSVGAIYCSYLKDTGLPNSGNVDCPAESQSKGVNRFFPTIGNHERSNLQNGIADYLNYFSLPGRGFDNSSGNERYYDFVQGPVHFFAIDSDSALQNAADMRAQKAWLKDALAKSTARWQVVYFHHAAFSSGSHGSRGAMQWPFAKWGADVVFQGHDHIYERIHRDGIVYIVSGIGGKSVRDIGKPIDGSVARYDDNFGAVRVLATSENLVIEAWSLLSGNGTNMTERGMLVDSLTLGEDNREECNSIFMSINDGRDDAREWVQTGAVDVSSVDLKLASDNGESQLVAFRFDDVSLPPDSQIKRAFLEFTARYDEINPLDLSIYTQDDDDAPPFEGNNFDLSNRPRSNEAVRWEDVPSWSLGRPRHKYYSSDLSPLFQKLVDRPGWQEGNALALFIESESNTMGPRTVYAFEHETEDAARLIVDFCSDAPSAVVLQEGVQGGTPIAPPWWSIGLFLVLSVMLIYGLSRSAKNENG